MPRCPPISRSSRPAYAISAANVRHTGEAGQQARGPGVYAARPVPADCRCHAGPRPPAPSGPGRASPQPPFSEMVSYAASKGVEVTASSNLMLVDRERAGEIVESGLQCLHVSVDGASASIYESIRKGASFSKLIGNVRLVMGAKERTSSRFPSMRMTVVLMRRNLPELAGLVKLASDLGMEQVFVQRLCHSYREAALPAHYRPCAPMSKERTLRCSAGDGSRAVRGGPRHSRMARRRASPSALTQ